MDEAERRRIERLRQLLFPDGYSPHQQDPWPQTYLPYPTASNPDLGQRTSQMFVPPTRQPLSLAHTLQGLEPGMANGFTGYGPVSHENLLLPIFSRSI